MSEIAAAPILHGTAERAGTKRLMLFFALVYLTEGIGQSDGLIAQPLNYYLKQVINGRRCRSPRSSPC